MFPPHPDDTQATTTMKLVGVTLEQFQTPKVRDGFLTAVASTMNVDKNIVCARSGCSGMRGVNGAVPLTLKVDTL